MDKRKGVTTSWFAGGDFKPCSFCGGESVVMQSSDGYTSIGCLKCNPPFGVMMQGDYSAVKKHWNTRYKEDEAHDADE